ncbi:hypothetical protein CcaCcLH18_08503 [Colletotrichum camelliae]|nr:hypothetical protein CcaCcLH18_08503 [Colletotrichum camelliae]
MFATPNKLCLVLKFFHNHFHFRFVQCFVNRELIINALVLFLNLDNYTFYLIDSDIDEYTFYLIIHNVDNYTNDDTNDDTNDSFSLHITFVYVFSPKIFIQFNRFVVYQCQLGCR